MGSTSKGLLGYSGTTVHGPEHPSRNSLFSPLREMVPEGRRHVVFCCPDLGTRGPLVPMSPTARQEEKKERKEGKKKERRRESGKKEKRKGNKRKKKEKEEE